MRMILSALTVTALAGCQIETVSIPASGYPGAGLVQGGSVYNAASARRACSRELEDRGYFVEQVVNLSEMRDGAYVTVAVRNNHILDRSLSAQSRQKKCFVNYRTGETRIL
jgi:hypothetical protein